MMPGFVDAHVHLTSTGLALANADVEATSSAEELIALARARASDGREGPVVLQGFDESRWDRPRVPTGEELDAVTARPLVIRRIDGHMSLANTPALAAAGSRPISRAASAARTGHPPVASRGRPTDRLGRWAVRGARRPSRGGAPARRGCRGGGPRHHERPRDVHARRGWVRGRGGLPGAPRTAAGRCRPVFVGTMDVARIVDRGLGAIGGDLPLGRVDRRADGGAEDAVRRRDRERSRHVRRRRARGVLPRCAPCGRLQVGIHAIGDAAIEQILVAWERVYTAFDPRERRHLRARRHRIEHAEMASPTQIERAAMLGIAASVQPAFDARWGSRGGSVRSGARSGARARDESVPFDARSWPRRRAGSDAPVTPLDPWGTVLAGASTHHDPSERLSRPEAWRCTRRAAQLAHQESRRERSCPGCTLTWWRTTAIRSRPTPSQACRRSSPSR